MDAKQILEAVRGLEPGDTGSWPKPTCKRTFPFRDPQALQAHLGGIERPIYSIEVYHRPNGGGYVAYIYMLN